MAQLSPKTNSQPFNVEDSYSWSALLKTAVPMLYSMLIRKSINPALAEELTQKTVFDAVKGKHTFDPTKGTAESWLMGIARNNLAAEFRSRSSRHIAGSELVDFIEAIDKKLLPDELLERSETALLVRRAMERLDEKERFVLQARYLDDLPTGSIAMKMEITQKAVHSLLYRAKVSLRDKLKSIAPSFKEACKK